MQRGNNHFRKEESGHQLHIFWKSFFNQDSFQNSNISVWALKLALNSNFMQEDLLFKDERQKKKLQWNYKDRWFKIYILVVNHRRLTNQTPGIKDPWRALCPSKTHKSEIFSLFNWTPDFCSASLDFHTDKL